MPPVVGTIVILFIGTVLEQLESVPPWQVVGAVLLLAFVTAIALVVRARWMTR